MTASLLGIVTITAKMTGTSKLKESISIQKF